MKQLSDGPWCLLLCDLDKAESMTDKEEGTWVES